MCRKHGGSLVQSVGVFLTAEGLLSKTASATKLHALHWGTRLPLHHQPEAIDGQLWRWTARFDWSGLAVEWPTDPKIHRSASGSLSLPERWTFVRKNFNKYVWFSLYLNLAL